MQALLEVSTTGYPSAQSIQFLRSNSVATYMRQVRVPTLIGQGQADTLFNLQESVATYTALKGQGTPVSLVWQSWGHSDSTPKPGELDKRHPEDPSRAGRRWPGSTSTCAAGGRSRRWTSSTTATGCSRPRATSARPTRPRPPTRSAATGPSSCRARPPPAATARWSGAGVRWWAARARTAARSRSGRTTPRRRDSTRSSRSPIRPGPPSASRHRSSPARWTWSARRG